jgi:hypothetical protein
LLLASLRGGIGSIAAVLDNIGLIEIDDRHRDGVAT